MVSRQLADLLFDSNESAKDFMRRHADDLKPVVRQHLGFIITKPAHTMVNDPQQLLSALSYRYADDADAAVDQLVHLLSRSARSPLELIYFEHEDDPQNSGLEILTMTENGSGQAVVMFPMTVSHFLKAFVDARSQAEA
jgi:hypothetical protein